MQVVCTTDVLKVCVHHCVLGSVVNTLFETKYFHLFISPPLSIHLIRCPGRMNKMSYFKKIGVAQKESKK